MTKKQYFVPALLTVAVLATLVGGQSVLRAQSQPTPVAVNNYAENGIVINAGSLGSDLGAADAILGSTRFPNGLETPTFTVTGTTTLQEMVPGSRFSKAFSSLSATATSAPGSFFQLRNTGEDKICHNPELNITKGDGGVNLFFRISTSTSATAHNAGAALVHVQSVIATTTYPFGTTGVFNGSTTLESFVWANGGYFNASLIGAVTASSTDFNDLAGEFYPNCHSL